MYPELVSYQTLEQELGNFLSQGPDSVSGFLLPICHCTAKAA